MYIKIWRPSPVSVSSEEKPAERMFRPISWFVVETTRYTNDMIPRESVDQYEADERILILRPPLDEGVELEYNEACVLRTQAPEQLTIVFDTTAYICNERGDTIEKICPQYKIKPGRLERFEECEECRAKPGSPVLCDDCLKRRLEWQKARQAQRKEGECPEGFGVLHRWSPWTSRGDGSYRYCMECKVKQTMAELREEEAKRRVTA